MSEASLTALMEALERLCLNDEVCQEACSKFIRLKVLNERDLESLLGVLSNLLLNQKQTLSVAYQMSEILPQIVTRALSDSLPMSPIGNVNVRRLHEKRCIVLSKLSFIHPDVLKYALKYFENNPSPFHYVHSSEVDAEPKAKRRKTNFSSLLTPVSDEELADCCYLFLRLNTNYFQNLWDWSHFLKKFFPHEEKYIQWLACQCFALLVKMSTHNREILLTSKFSSDEIVYFTVKFSQKEEMLKEHCAKFCLDDQLPTFTSLPQIQNSGVISVVGITLPLSSQVTVCTPSLVLVHSTQRNLQAIALGIATGKTLCLQGPVGCGKTALVGYLAELTGRGCPPYFLSIQLGDQTDSKMLLGTYQCTDIPGEFVWKPGVLTQAVVGGFWLLLEDIDSCTTDVAAVLSSLLETGSLSVPGYKDCVHAAPGFQLFFTQRLISGATGLHKLHTGVTSMLQRHWLTVQMEPLSQSELVDIVQTLHPSLITVASRMVEVFLLFSAGSHHTALISNEGSSDQQNKTIRLQTVGARLPSTRDLIKWCNRSSKAFDVSSPESGLRLFQDAIDIFCCNVSNPATRLTLAESVAAKLGIIHTKAGYFCNIHKPVICSSTSQLVAGRVSLPRQNSDNAVLQTSTKATFCFTRPTSALLERVASCIHHSEPVLLVGETGVGKTSSIQYLAQQMGQSLSVINMNQQSDSADLLGGYKPVEMKFVISPIRDEFESLFRKFFSGDKNARFLSHIASCFSMKKWSKLIELMKYSTAAALKRFDENQSSFKVFKQNDSSDTKGLKQLWIQLSIKLHRLDDQVKKSQNALAFAFVEGSLVRALKKGHWVLLDEINLASAQTLECLSSLLEGATGSLYLLERGDEHSIKRHPNFRIFAAMNPATDVGKKELPPGIRNRFTEFYVDELVDRQDLLLLCSSYLVSLALPASKLEALVRFYLSACQEAVSSLSDGTGQKPHYSLRTLCRALSVAAANPCGSVPRSLYEGILLSFLTQLDRSSHPVVEEMVAKAVTGKNSYDQKSLVKQPIPTPIVSGKSFVQVEGYWITQGSLEPNTPEKYILTKTVRRNLRDLVRIVSLARLPVLLQGETSVGKTSLITFLAQLSGNRCLRINNHEHTDLQEYVGCYAADEHGNLVFKEGVLVEAMKHGHWVILDELNLAPSDVLEALNRVLDDNRELFIPETQKTVKAHPNFMLFATQNPPGLYGGRKVLSRAFRNRFIELHFDEIPSLELETILHLRCDMPPSYCKKMVAVMSDLQVRRKGSAAFAGKQGFITLRDLFRWGERYRLARQVEQGKYYDWDQHIADEGYLILAGRVRKEEERIIIQEALRKYIKRAVEPQNLFTLSTDTSPVTKPILESIIQKMPLEFRHIVWTYNMRRLAVLLGKACEFNEPILLVGETGCGKTTLCQLLAASRNQNLASVNCHMHSESADFLGGLRPVRERVEEEKGKLFEWVDGPLIEAMTSGGVFLADEISLADDSVLERLNSLLEPERKLLLTEKGSDVNGGVYEVVAQDGFIFVGTMNPGGDYGKKELSPALRNRFTEIWCEGCSQREDLIAIIEHNLRPGLVFKTNHGNATSVGAALLDFLEWFCQTELGNRSSRSIRDILTWVEFINICSKPSVNLDLGSAYIHGACLTFLDSLGTGLTSFSSKEAVCSVRVAALEFLRKQVKAASTVEPASVKSFMALESDDFRIMSTAEKFGLHPFYVSRGSPALEVDSDFLLSAPTTHINAVRLLRGLQLGKAMLLEGSPGVGKTSLVAAVARAAGYKLTRINLSDQTDVSDLFGADLPVEGGLGGEFAWRDGPFLQALKAGDWILLDELNLASQSVLEGLNAVLDHRGDLFIPELGRTFHIQSGRTRLFACQNPLNQGGARKGLPQSFLNRFTQVHMETLTSDDLEHICQALYPVLPPKLIKSMVMFNQHAASETAPGGKWGQRGAPWELNLRDLSRWCEITAWGASNGALNPGRFVQLLYVDRMRTLRDEELMKELYSQYFAGEFPLLCDVPQIHITPSTLYLGDVAMKRKSYDNISPKLVLRHQLPALQSLARCASLGWLSILVGPAGCGKTSLVHLLAQLAGRDLKTLAVNSAMDTTEILGGFEQADYKRHLDELTIKVDKILTTRVQTLTLLQKEKESNYLFQRWEAFVHTDKMSHNDEVKSVQSETKLFSCKIDLLMDILHEIAETCITKEEQEELNHFQGKLVHLKKCFSRDNSLNAGGKFEWVDSILVKSLIDGSWLLVDNVNLCSAAVLDRLNGLLEPNGVLTISERGVNANGELVTIHPHPDFRLFLTMDPKYGEISRAMRNRGVEIYITSCESDMTTSLSQLDIAALLCDLGIVKQHDQQVILSTHQTMLSAIHGPDPPGLTELLQASYLFIQQVLRGMPSIPSLLSSFTKVYIQSRLCDSIDCKRRNLGILEESIGYVAEGDSCGALDKLVKLSTLKTGDLYLDPCLSTVKQRCAILSALSNAQESDLTKVLQFLGLKGFGSNVDFQTVLTSLLVFFYQMCSVNDVSLATKWLQREVDESNHAVIINQISETLHHTFRNIGDLAACHLLWDRRWLPDVSQALVVLSGVDDQGVENRVSSLLYVTAHYSRNKVSFDIRKMKKQKNVSVLEYSQAVSKGAIADTLSSETIFIEISPLLEMTFDLMNEALNTIGVVVSDEQWLSIRNAFTWTLRCQKSAASLSLSSDKNAIAEALNLLAVHYRWLLKHTIPLVRCLAQAAALDDSSFQSVVAKIDASVCSRNSLLWFVGKRLRSEMGQPMPMASKLQASHSCNAFNIGSTLNLWRREKDVQNLAQVTHFLSTPEGLLAKASLIVAIKDIIINTDLSKVQEKLQQTENICSEVGLLSPTRVPAEPMPKRSLSTFLWPFLEVVCLYASSPLLLKILQGQCVSSCPLEYSVFIQALKNAPSTPPALIGFFEALESVNHREEISQGVTWLFQLSNQSLAVSSSQFWNLSDLEFGTDLIDSQETLPQHCPVLSRLAANLLFCHKPSSKEQLAMSSLEQHTSHAKLLNNLRTLLWQNSERFSSPSYSYRENEVKSVLASTLYFIRSLEKICDTSSKESENLYERVSNITEYLQQRLGDRRVSTLSDFFSLLLELVQVIDFVKKANSVENETLTQVGLSWAYLGCLESHLFSAFPKIDPSSKHAIKHQYATEEILAVKSELLAAKMMGSVRGLDTDCLPSHSHVKILKNNLDSLEQQLSILNRQVALRPEPSMYFALTKEMQHSSNSLSSIPVIMKLTKRILSVHKSSSQSDCLKILKEAQTWLQSQKSFGNMLEKRFGVWYPDIVGPLLASHAKLTRGIELMVGVAKKISLCSPASPHHSSLSKLVCSLGSFPSMGPEQPSIMNLLSNLANRHSPFIMEQMLQTVVGKTSDLQDRSQTEAFWLLKSAVMELKNYICLSKSCKSDEWNALVKVLRSFKCIWEKQETERREREQDNESLYKSRGAVRCQTVSEDDEDLNEIAEMFPSVRKNDFGDLEPKNTLEEDLDEKNLIKSNSSTLSVMMDDDDVALVSSVHMSLALAFTSSVWIDCSTTNSPSVSPDFLSAWMQRCAVTARLISLCSHILDDYVDKCLLSSWILASHIAAPRSGSGGNSASISPENPLFDFYRTPCIPEVKQCKPVLDGLLKRVNELLCEWPEHPTLNQITVVVNRITSFSIESPLARFLTGLEILLNKMKEWEENAHSGVSLASNSMAVTQLIIQWRRVELSCWKGCLNAAVLRMQKKASRWWFYIFSLVDSFVHPPPDKNVMNGKDLVASLQQFMEDAPLGEFKVRLDMILAFHCHVANLTVSSCQMELESVLWNLHKFYSQFQGNVENRINELRAPIEKKLKDFVKIARWNDINYWAVKDAIFKTQRTLHKHVKEFEVVLKQSVKSTMLSSRLEGKLQSSEKDMQLNPSAHVANDKFVSDLSGLDTKLESSSVVFRVGPLFSRSKKLAREIILTSVSPGRIAALNEFANNVAESVQQLASLEVDRSIPKSKQVSHAKNQLQMKRKALADLFRMLQRIGLSYHKGLTYEENDLKHEFTQLPPLDVSICINSLNKATGCVTSNNRADQELLNAWDGCSPYFMRSWARYAQLIVCLRNTHKDHGPPNIERIRGFPAHLLVLMHSQHLKVHESTNILAQMRLHLFYLKSLQEFVNEPLPSQTNLCHWDQRLKSLVVSSLFTLEQFRLLLDACPDSEDFQGSEENIPVIFHGSAHTSDVLGAVKPDFNWNKAVEIIDGMLLCLHECQKQLNSDSSNLPSSLATFVTVSYFRKMMESFNSISIISDNILKVESLFQPEHTFHPYLRSLKWLREHMLNEYHKFSEMCKMSFNNNSGENPALFYEVSKKANDMVQNILLGVQNLYKDHTQTEEQILESTSNNDAADGVVDQQVQDVDDNDLDEKHLSDAILKTLVSDLDNLSVKGINKNLQAFMNDIFAIIGEGGQSSLKDNTIKVALQVVPLLNQWLLLYQFIVQQQVAAYRASAKLLSILLAVLGDVAAKGFCMPEDLMSAEEAGEGEGQPDGKEDGSMGLGDGEGEKDVSDRIESEDQLDDAQPAGEEKKNEDKDCQEEENGIEMSENFDGKLQDVNPMEDDAHESDDEDDDKDAEKEMGDTEKDADQLDEKIWGSDSEDNDGDDGDGDDEDEGNSGEKSGEKEVGAREHDANQGDRNEDPDENGEKENEKNKPEINEMKEPEIDDDQVDPYHGHQKPEVEPDALELPEDMKLDEGEDKENEEGNEENPFDIDEMKEKLPPEVDQKDNNKENDSDKEGEGDKSAGESSDDEDATAEPGNEDDHFEEPAQDEQTENAEDSDERKNGEKQEDVEKNNEDEGEEAEKNENDEMNPSKDDPTSEQPEAAEDTPQGSMDQVASTSEMSQEISGEKPEEEAHGDPGGEERDAVGQAPACEEMQGHHSDRSGKRPQRDQQKRQPEEEQKRQRPGHSDEQRSLADIEEPVKKRLKTLDVKQSKDEDDEGNPEEHSEDADTTADLYQHIKDLKEQSKAQTLDAATKEQADKQPVASNEEEESPLNDEDEAMHMDDDEASLDDCDQEEKKSEETVSGTKNEKQKKDQGKLPIQRENEELEQNVEVEGEKVPTLSAMRAPETTFHTRFEDLALSSIVTVAEVEEKSEALRQDLLNQLASWNVEHAGEEASKAWQSLSSLTNSLARDLSEQLRLVLEPTLATRMKGDFRTGRRINMRKVIPYIASQFRKDKIWMRRTKPSKREYQILLAIDDSSSMADNRSKELAFESLALVSQALTLLEVGELGVLSFGEVVKVLHKLGEPFTQYSGASLLQQFSFEQRKTQVGVLVDFATSLLSTSKARTSAEHAQLLVVISDGRGVFSEGQEKVNSCVRKARLSGIFMVFVIIDNPESKDSILDIRTPVFSEGKLLGISSYMDSFPFPFYLILRDISNLPAVLSDALRQWFELVSNAE